MPTLGAERLYEDYRLTADEDSPVIRVAMTDSRIRELLAMHGRYTERLEGFGDVASLSLEHSKAVAEVVRDFITDATDEETYLAALAYLGGGEPPEECNVVMIDLIDALASAVAEQGDRIKDAKLRRYTRRQPDAI